MTMNYWERLQCRAAVRLLPGMQRVVVEQFRSRMDAKGHAQALAVISRRIVCCGV